MNKKTVSPWRNFRNGYSNLANARRAYYKRKALEKYHQDMQDPVLAEAIRERARLRYHRRKAANDAH